MSKQQRFEAMVRAYSSDLYRFAYWLCKDPVQAEDLVQETFTRAWKAFDSLEDEKAVKSWLLTIVKREHARLYQKGSVELVDIESQELPDQRFTVPSQSTNRSDLHKAIAQLESDFRMPLLLQVSHGLSNEEIADVLGLNKNTVMTRLFRARNKLRDFFGSFSRASQQSVGDV